MSERRFQLVLVELPFTRSLPARIQWLIRHKPLRLSFLVYTKQTFKKKFETLMETLALKSELFLHTYKNQIFSVKD